VAAQRLVAELDAGGNLRRRLAEYQVWLVTSPMP
jgi:hypothetical protein